MSCVSLGPITTFSLSQTDCVYRIVLYFLVQNFKFVYFMSLNILPSCEFIQHECFWYPWRSEEGIRFPGTGVIDRCKLSSMCCEPNPGLLEEQWVLFTFKSLSCPWGKSFRSTEGSSQTKPWPLYGLWKQVSKWILGEFSQRNLWEDSIYLFKYLDMSWT